MHGVFNKVRIIILSCMMSFVGAFGADIEEKIFYCFGIPLVSFCFGFNSGILLNPSYVISNTTAENRLRARLAMHSMAYVVSNAFVFFLKQSQPPFDRSVSPCFFDSLFLASQAAFWVGHLMYTSDTFNESLFADVKTSSDNLFMRYYNFKASHYKEPDKQIEAMLCCMQNRCVSGALKNEVLRSVQDRFDQNQFFFKGRGMFKFPPYPKLYTKQQKNWIKQAYINQAINQSSLAYLPDDITTNIKHFLNDPNLLN